MKYVFKIRAENRGWVYVIATNISEAVAHFDTLMRPLLPQEIEKLGVAHDAPELSS
jgi:hypothetical protein